MIPRRAARPPPAECVAEGPRLLAGTPVRRVTAGPDKAADPTPDRRLAGLMALLELERDARRATTPAELTFLMANRTQCVVAADQVAVWRQHGVGAVRLERVSSVAGIDRSAPFVPWLEGVIAAALCGATSDRAGGTADGPAVVARSIDADALDNKGLAVAWPDFSPPNGLVCPLDGGLGVPAGLWLARGGAWNEADRVLVERLAETYAHAWRTLVGTAGPRPRRRVSWPVWLAAAVLAAGVLALPVRQTVMAPAEITPTAPVVVTAPLDGVVATVAIEPGQAVSSGDVLFRLDDTGLRSRLEIAEKGLGVAQAELYRARQLAFGDDESQAALAVLEARVALRQAEVAQARTQLVRSTVRAPRAGIALFDDPSAWRGRPVVTGERVMRLADPERVEVAVALPAADAITLEPGAAVRVFLNTAPLDPLPATLIRSSYAATPTAAGVLAFTLAARLEPTAADNASPPPRIGLKGTAEVSGRRTVMALYLFRRPLTVLRRWIGW